MTTVLQVIDAARETRLNLSEVEALGVAIAKAHHVYTVGNGGSAAHASHCASDLRRLGRVQATCLNDSISDYSAGVNDDRRKVYAYMLGRLGFGEHDLLLIFSVGGGDKVKGVSEDLYKAADFARRYGSIACVFGRRGDIPTDFDGAMVHIECPVPELITPVVESVMPLVWHALVAGPLKREEPVWR